MHDFVRRDGEIWKGAVAGMAGGLVASWVMNQFHLVAQEIGEAAKNGKKRPSSEEEGEDATVKTAERISEGVFEHKLSEDEKKVAGPAVHYAMGAVSGGIYGLTAELLPIATRGTGMPFGAAVWLAADEVAVPALGLSGTAPAPSHGTEFVAHLVYGLTTDLVRRAIRRVL